MNEGIDPDMSALTSAVVWPTFNIYLTKAILNQQRRTAFGAQCMCCPRNVLRRLLLQTRFERGLEASSTLHRTCSLRRQQIAGLTPVH